MIDPVSAPNLNFKPDANINTVRNPAGVVILQDSERSEKTVPIVEVTKATAMVGGKEVQADTDLLEWSIVDVNETAPGTVENAVSKRAAFFDPTKMGKGNVGGSVYVYGTTKGRIRLEVRRKGQAKEKALEAYEAFVVENKNLPFRIHLCYSTKDDIKTSAEDTHVEAHIAVANIYLRQVGITLVADANEKAGAKAKLIKKGYFKVEGIDPELINNVPKVEKGQPLGIFDINPSEDVLNVYYIYKTYSVLVPARTPYAPSNSLATKDKDAGGYLTVRLNYRLNSDPKSGKEYALFVGVEPHAKNPKLWGVLMSNFVAHPGRADICGNVLAHETGHALNLLHRDNTKDEKTGEPYGDGLDEQKTNIMHASLQALGSDFDLIQLYAMRACSALK